MRKPRLTQRRALNLITEHHPSTPEQFEELGIALEPIGEGAFRETSKIKGLPLVVKFPLPEGKDEDDYRRGKIHTTTEINKIEILHTFKELRPFLPRVYYHNRETGVLVVRHYPEFATVEEQFLALSELVRRLIHKLTKVKLGDIHTGNFHKRGKKSDDGVIIDLGY